MQVPDCLQSLADQGVIEEVIRPLQSGKEAQVYLVVADGQRCVAKVYKEATNRSFKHRSDYTEGRKVRNTRSQRAMAKRSKFGRAQMEEEWRTAEVDAIYRLHAAGVRVPEPYAFVDGVLVMELIADQDGHPAPRLVDIHLGKREALDLFNLLLREVIKMLCAGLVHGDLSDFNILLSSDGPVLIDFPQVIHTANNRNAGRILIRDVNNVTRFLARYAPVLRGRKYGQEMWALYESNQLTVHSELTGRYRRPKKKRTDTDALLAEFAELERASRERREALGLGPPRRARQPTFAKEPTPEPAPQRKKRRRKKKKAKSAETADPFDDLDALLTLE